jgi:hypothetical protein
MTKKSDPAKKTSRWDPRREFDVITVSPSGSILWKDYGRPRRYVVTRGNESPRDIAERDREKNEKRERDMAQKEKRR